MVSFKPLSSDAGLTQLNTHLLTRSYIEGYQASRDDLAVYASIATCPDAKKYPHAARWWSHIKALLGASFPGVGKGVSIEGASSSAPSTATPPAAPPAKAAKEEEDKDLFDDDDDEEDLDLFGEMTEEEKAAADAKKKAIDDAKKRSAEKALLTKSMIIMDVKPWDDTTDMAKLEAEVRGIQKEGLLWGTSKLVPVGFGIKKLQITCVIEDAKIESMDSIIEEEIVRDGESENIQSVDVVAFNKL